MNIINVVGNVLTKVDTKKVLGIAGIAVNIAGAIISSKTQSYDRKLLKAELKQELFEELLKEKN